MSATVLPLDGDGHHAVQALLPWYVTARLDAAEVATVEAHLAGCAPCRAELEWERLMAAAQAGLGSSDGHAERGLALLRGRIEATDRNQRSPTPIPSTPRRDGWGGAAPWLRWALGGQFATILLLAALLVLPLAPSTSYHALGTPGRAAPGNAVVRFRPDATERDIRLALQEVGARLVDGPTVTDAYLLSVPADHQADALARLRAKPIVALAESLDGGARP